MVNSRMFPLFLSSWCFCLHNLTSFAGPIHSYYTLARYLILLCTFCLLTVRDFRPLAPKQHALTNLRFARWGCGISQSSLFAQGHTFSCFSGQILTKPFGNFTAVVLRLPKMRLSASNKGRKLQVITTYLCRLAEGMDYSIRDLE